MMMRVNIMSVHGDEIVLTAEGRRLLRDRIRRLRHEILPGLVEAVDDRRRDGRVEAEFERANEELGWLSFVLSRARAVEDVPDDPRVVQLGDTVAIQLEDGTIERYTIVHPVEAPLDERRISSGSPLSRSLLSRRVGEEVEVAAPSGPYLCVILSATREGGRRRGVRRGL